MSRRVRIRTWCSTGGPGSARPSTASWLRRGGSESACLAIRGEPGAGKTALLDYAAERADGFRLLRATGAPSESALPFAGLEQLLRPVLAQLEVLPEVQVAAVQAALGLRPGDGADRFLVGLATLTLLSEHAGAGPLLVLVDDLQWLDQESADTLRFVARRLGAEGVVLLLATTEPAGVEELALHGLGRVASDALLLDRADVAPHPRCGRSRGSRRAATRLR